MRSFSIRNTLLGLILASTLGVVAGGCTTACDSAMEKVGTHKRDILKSRIESGQEEQKEAQEQIKTTYQRFQELTGYAGGDLEGDIALLIKDIDASIQESERFLATLETAG